MQSRFAVLGRNVLRAHTSRPCRRKKIATCELLPTFEWCCAQIALCTSFPTSWCMALFFTAMIAAVYIPGLRDAGVRSTEAFLESPGASIAVEAYTDGANWRAAMLTFAGNLLFAALATTTLPSLIIPFFGVAATIARAVFIGLPYAPTSSRSDAPTTSTSTTSMASPCSATQMRRSIPCQITYTRARTRTPLSPKGSSRRSNASA